MMIRKILLLACATFVASCTAFDAQPSANGERVSLIIASETTDCVGVAPQTCLLVKETRSQQDWHYFYSNIEGFDYKPGYEYQLIVDKVPRDMVAADQSSIAYHLVREISKEKRVSENLPKIIHAKTTWNQRK